MRSPRCCRAARSTIRRSEAHMITVPEVRMSPDLRLATIYVMPLGGKDAKQVVAALERNKNFLRGEIAHRVNLKFAPDIRFRLDERFDEAERIEKLLRTPRSRAATSNEGRRRRANEPQSVSQPGAATAEGPAAPREKRDVHGWIMLDKPVGMTSTHAVAVIKRLFTAQARRPRRHARSARLGLLPIALGEATKTVPFVMDGAQALPLHGALGRGARHRRRRGQGRRDRRRAPERGCDRGLLPRFTGTIAQVPPQFSAIKIDGERAYDLARDGEDGELEARPVEIHGLDPGRHAGRRSCGFRGRMRQGHLCAGAGPRHRPRARLPRPCLGAAPHRRSARLAKTT